MKNLEHIKENLNLNLFSVTPLGTHLIDLPNKIFPLSTLIFFLLHFYTITSCFEIFWSLKNETSISKQCFLQHNLGYSESLNCFCFYYRNETMTHKFDQNNNTYLNQVVPCICTKYLLWFDFNCELLTTWNSSNFNKTENSFT